MGLIGFGRMGKAYTIRAHAFGMNVQFYDPYRPQGEDKSMGVTQCETLVRRCLCRLCCWLCYWFWCWYCCRARFGQKLFHILF